MCCRTVEWAEHERSLLRLDRTRHRLGLLIPAGDINYSSQPVTSGLTTSLLPNALLLLAFVYRSPLMAAGALGHKAGNYQSTVAGFFPPTRWVPRCGSDLSKLSLGGYPGCFPLLYSVYSFSSCK